jgi:hypothetical protein
MVKCESARSGCRPAGGSARLTARADRSEQWAFCNEFGGTGLHDVSGITASLMNSPVWTFWWD